MSNFYNKDSCNLQFDENGVIVGVQLDKKEIRGLKRVLTDTSVNEPTILCMEIRVEGFSTERVDNK